MEEKKSILFLSPLKPYSGNQATIERIRWYLDPLYHCYTEDATIFSSLGDFYDFLKEKQISAVLAIHAYHSGSILLGHTVPYILVFGGTDVNEFYRDEKKFQIMTQVIHQAEFAVAFSDSVINKAKTLWPDVNSEKLHVIPQGAYTVPSKNFDVASYLKERHSIWSEDGTPLKLFTLIAGIRPVKDVTFLVQAFSAWHLEGHTDCFLLIIGPPIDRTYSLQVCSLINSCSGVVHIPGIDKPDCHAMIRDSFALVNSSLSEGMSAALIEAMAMGVPIIARNIPGNAAVITHRETGLLFDSPQEFIELAQELLQDSDLRTAIGTHARYEAENKYSCIKEKESYRKLLHDILYSSM